MDIPPPLPSSVDPVDFAALDVALQSPRAPDRRDAGDGQRPATRQPYDLTTFKRQTGSVGLEVAAAALVMSATRVDDLGQGFRFKNEGWFGKSTYTLGMDKMHHAWKTYVITDILQSLIARRTGDERGAAITASLLGIGLMTYGEVLDGFSKGSGYSEQDSIAHIAGAAVSLLRNTVPGARDKIDFRMEVEPEFEGSRRNFANQLTQRKYLLAGQLAGFRSLERSPLRFVELHVGYYARGIGDFERARGDPLTRKVYVGLGFNVQQLFARKPRSTIERIAKGTLDYLQLPYTSVELD